MGDGEARETEVIIWEPSSSGPLLLWTDALSMDSSRRAGFELTMLLDGVGALELRRGRGREPVALRWERAGQMVVVSEEQALGEAHAHLLTDRRAKKSRLYSHDSL